MKQHPIYTYLLIAVRLLALASVGLWPLRPAQAQTGFHVVVNQIDRSAFPQVTTYVTVSDPSGVPVTGLSRDSFTVVEDRSIVSSFDAIPASSEPLSLAIALDVSGSVMGAPFRQVLRAAARLIERLGPQDQIALITFGDQVSVPVPLTKDKVRAATTLLDLNAASQQTVLWEGTHEAIRQLSLQSAGHRAVIVITDGKDTNSALDFGDVALEAIGQGLVIFPVGFGNVEDVTLGQLASMTGGAAFIAPDTSQLGAQFDGIFNLLRQQYAIHYTSVTPADTAEHRLMVRVSGLPGGPIEGSAPFITTPKAVPFTVSLPGFTNEQKISVCAQTHFVPAFTPPVPIQSVGYLLDGSLIFTATAPPFDYTWTSAAKDAGPRIWTVRATAVAGNTSEQAILFNIAPALTVTLTTPATIVDRAMFEVQVSAFCAIAKVEFFVDGNSIGAVTAAPYKLDWDSASVAGGDHTVKVIVTDVNGQTATASQAIVVEAGIGWGAFFALAVVLVAVGIIVPMSLRSRRRVVYARRVV